MMKARDYQQKAEDCAIQQWQVVKSTLIVMPTGCGKTETFKTIIERMVKATGKKAIVCADREELIFQAAEKIKRSTSLSVDIEMGNYKATQDAELFCARADVIIATRQTLSMGGDGGGRVSKFDPMDFCLLVIDECDGAVADSYRRIIEYFQTNPDLKLLGVTATPDRSDEESLGQIFETVAFNYLLSDPLHLEPNAIDDGWLVPVEQYYAIIEDMDLTNVGSSAGDLNGADLEAVLENENTIQQTVECIFEVMHGLEPKSLFDIPIAQWESKVSGIKPKRAIAFTRFVQHAEILSNILNRIKTGFSNCISQRTPRENRPSIIKSFKNGEVSIICNADILTRGYDDDGVEIVFMCAPTKSRSKYAQRAGRGTRPHGSIAKQLGTLPIPALRRGLIARSPKPRCIIVDLVGDSGRHKLCSCADLLAGNVSERAIESATKFARTAGRSVPVVKVLEEEEKKEQERLARKQLEENRKKRIVAKTSYKLQAVDPFDKYQIKPVKSRGWDKGKILSDKQKEIFRDHLERDPDEYVKEHGYTKAKQLIDLQFEIWNKKLCSFRMINYLAKFGINGVGMKKETGSAWLDAIKANGGRKPANFIPPIPKAPPPLPQRRVAMAGEIDDSDIPF